MRSLFSLDCMETDAPGSAEVCRVVDLSEIVVMRCRMDREDTVPSTADAANYNRGIELGGEAKMQTIALGDFDGKGKMPGRETFAADGKG
jgi:hypothetical protein